MEIDPQMLQVSITILKYLGISTLGSFIALYSAWLAFPPELLIEGVVDKSKKFNSESRIKIRNSGKLPALSVKADAEKICAQFGGINMNDCGIASGPDVIGRLTHNEVSEISIRPGIELGQGMQITSFSYELTLKYYAILFFLKKEMKKKWKVELKNFQDGYSWNITILK